MRRVLAGLAWCVVGLTILGGPAAGWIAAGEVAIVGRGSAVLVVRTAPDSAWRPIDEGEPLPEQCELRSAGNGFRQIRLDHAQLAIEGGAIVRWDVPQQRVQLLAGRIAVRGLEPSAWRIAADDVSAPIAAESRSVWTRLASGQTVVQALEQQLALQPALGAQPVTLAASWQWSRPGPGQPAATTALAAAELAQRTALFHDEPMPQGLGQLVVEDAQSGTPQRLEIAQYRVNVVLQPPVALVQIDQSFYNPFPRQMEGTFVFNLPAGAAVSRFAMYVTREQLIEGELVERQRANEVYTAIVSKRRDPAILEEIGNNLFRMRVFPIFAQDTKRILLDYTVPLEPVANQYRFRLPLFSDLKPIWDFAITGQLQGDVVPASLTSPTHSQLEVRRGAGGEPTTFRWTERDFQPRSDLLLSFRGAAAEQVAVRAQLAEARAATSDHVERDPRSTSDTTYFMLTVPPSALDGGNPPSAPADVLLLIDTSELARNRSNYTNIARTVLRHLPAEHRLRVAVVDVNHRFLSDDWLRAGTPQAEQVLAQIERQYALGASRLWRTIPEAVREAFRADEPAPDDQRDAVPRRKVILLLAEGGDSVSPGKAAPLVRSSLDEDLRGKSCTLSALLPSDRLRHLPGGLGRLQELVSATSGLIIDAQSPSGQVQLLQWTLAGLPSAATVELLEVKGAFPGDILYSASWLPGMPFRIYGRAGAVKQMDMKLVVRRDGRAREVRQALPIPAENDLFVGRAWAQRRIASWQAADGSRESVSDMVRRQIVAVSQEWSVLSPFTAFLVLETEQDYARWKIDRSVRRKYWRPAGTESPVVVSAEWLARIKADKVAGQRESRLADSLARARQLLADGDYAGAYWALSGLDAPVPVDQLDEIDRLRQAAEAGLSRESRRRLVTRDFPIFVPQNWRWTAAPSWSRLILPVDEPTTEIPGSRFIRQLSVPVRIAEMRAQSLRDLLTSIEFSTGVPIDIDRRALEAAGIGTDTEVQVNGSGEVSLGSYLWFVLHDLSLDVMEEPDRLVVTTREECENRLSTEVYSLADLLLSDGTPTPKQLRFSAAETQRRTAADRLHKALREPVTIEIVAGSPLDLALAQFADRVGIPLVLDLHGMEGAAIGRERPIDRFRAQNIPAGVALRRLLKEHELNFVVRHEAVHVTTNEAVESAAHVRLYSGRQLVQMEPVEQVVALDYGTQPPTRRVGWWPNGIWPRGGMLPKYARPYFSSVVPVLDGARGMGGMGGGMGGMGGRMGGGFFGGPGPAADPSRLAFREAAAGLSSGGESLEPTRDTQGSPATGDSGPSVAGGGGERTQSRDVLKPPKFAPNPQPLLDLIPQVTGRPEPGWVDDGGISRIEYFDPTSDFIVRTTDEVHEQVERLLERLARLSTGTSAKAAVSTPPLTIDRSDSRLIGFDDLVNLIQNMVAVPEPGWVDDGGVNNLAVDESRLAVIVSATQSSHDELHTLLTLFRRSRYEAKFGTRPWQVDVAPLFGGRRPTGGIVPAAPKASFTPAELARLAIRQPTPLGRRHWQRVERQGLPQAVTLALGDGRLEFLGPGYQVRIVGPDVAESYPQLGSAVLHRDRDAVRKQIDEALPWWPHRTNEELATLYSIDELPEGNSPQETGLRLTPRVSSDAAVANLQAFFDRQSGQLLRYEIHVDGQLVGKLSLTRSDPKHADRVTAELADSDGRTLVAWQPVEKDEQVTEIANIDAPWQGFAVLDQRTERPTVDSEYASIVAALSRADWRVAFEQLQTAIQSRPELPLLRLLRGFCALSEPMLATRDKALEDLREAVASPASDIGRLLATQAQFEQLLTVEELLDVLSRQPEARRSVDEWLRLGRLAQRRGDVRPALEYVRRGVQQAVASQGGDFDADAQDVHRRYLIQLLLLAQQGAEARQLANEILAPADVGANEVLSVCELFADHNDRESALAILLEQLASPRWNAATRYRLTRRAADLAEGFARARLLCDGLQLGQDSADARRADIERVVGCLKQSDEAQQLLERVTVPDLRLRLRYAQALLTDDSDRAARLLVDVLMDGPIPVGQDVAVLDRLLSAKQFAACVAWFEGELRAGRSLDRSLYSRFATALQNVGRNREAERLAP